MAFAGTSSQRSVAEINITPLVDVMLVLLVIFMVAAPIMTRRIPLDLPQRAPHSDTVPAVVTLRIDAAGGLSWNGAPTSAAALPAQLAAIAPTQVAHPPLLQVEPNADADYAAVAQVLALARNAGVEKIGFVRRR